MLTLTVEDHFDSSHHLVGYEGKCANDHGHRWVVIAKWKFDEDLLTIDRTGIALDFKSLKEQLGQVTEILDHHCLNDTIAKPTAENISKWIFDKLSGQVDGGLLVAVTLYESPDCSCTYERG